MSSITLPDAIPPSKVRALTQPYRWLARPSFTGEFFGLDESGTTTRTTQRYALRRRRHLHDAEQPALSPDFVELRPEHAALFGWLAPLQSTGHPLRSWQIQLECQKRELLQRWRERLAQELTDPYTLVLIFGGDRSDVNELLREQVTQRWRWLDLWPGQSVRSVLEDVGNDSVSILVVDLLAVLADTAATQQLRDVLYFVANGARSSSATPSRFILYSALGPSFVGKSEQSPQFSEAANSAATRRGDQESENVSSPKTSLMDAFTQSVLDELLTVRERPHFNTKSMWIPSLMRPLESTIMENGLFLPGPLLFDATALMMLDKALRCGRLAFPGLLQLIRYAYCWVQARLVEQPNAQAALESSQQMYAAWIADLLPAWEMLQETCAILEMSLTPLALQAHLMRSEFKNDHTLQQHFRAALAHASRDQLLVLSRVWKDAVLEGWILEPASVLQPSCNSNEARDSPPASMPAAAPTSRSSSREQTRTTACPTAAETTTVHLDEAKSLETVLVTSKRRRQQLQAALAATHQRPGSLQRIRMLAVERFLTSRLVQALRPPPAPVAALFAFPGAALAEASIPTSLFSSVTLPVAPGRRKNAPNSDSSTSSAFEDSDAADLSDR